MSRRGTFRWVALAAALAVALMGLLPAAHVHHGDAGPTVHRHAADVAGDHHDHHEGGHQADGAAEHSSVHGAEHHLQAQLLPDEFLAAPLFWLNTPAVASVPLGQSPLAHAWRRLTQTARLPTHDPPLRYFSSPAPPRAS